MLLTPEQALSVWYSATLSGVRGDTPDLTARQMALLLTVYLTPQPHTVRGLAHRLNVAKPAISRALTRLGHFGLVKRKIDNTDRRNVFIYRTVKGSVYLRDFAETIIAASRQISS